ncbi:MAG: precorrin-8X methylmutase, partial [Anaerovibrio sp.]|nr:precorrin-8X methylmutase [Anaerovibrio sp.]
MDYIKQPMEIENKSMEIIGPYLKELNLNEEATKVYSRIIHAAGDVEYAPIIKIHPSAIAAGK